MAHPRAGLPALPEDLIDLTSVIAAYYDLKPDATNPEQAVTFGTSGHRGSSLDGAFNEKHIVAITQAIVEYRRTRGITGPLFIAKDTHALSLPAWKTAIEVLLAQGITVFAERENEYTPTPALSHAIISYNRTHQLKADGVIVTPSHNPPRDGGFKYNLPNGGPADDTATAWIAARANELLISGTQFARKPYEQVAAEVQRFDYTSAYCGQLTNVVNVGAINAAKLTIGADPMGGASIGYWQWLREHTCMQISIVNETVDPTWRFMTLDSDGKIRMDCSSPAAMASLIAVRDKYDIATANDADADRHGIVTPDAGLLNPNQYLAVAIKYLIENRPDWKPGTAIGKTLVSSSMIDKVTELLGRRLIEVPVGFKWFVPGLISGALGFGGEESAGASFLDFDGETWTTDKDGIIMNLLAAELTARTGKTPSQHYIDLEERFGRSYYARIDAAATHAQKSRLATLTPSDISVTTLAGQPITAVFSNAPGNNAPIGGIKVITETGWFAARPSGTENKYKIYAESCISQAHLEEIQLQAKDVVDATLALGL
ncbi:MAG: phosphoglucomutase (alpha-D-glucose-1,6-bisphosphate-dependent) [Propionibacteriaceae bacterium]|jgi:phosphoglucomutase|nr:phosphoglucomutase (alpha-D-glucose-1,6-bisphosphate-dependent) [Propionibacteriaceae bacterium]